MIATKFYIWYHSCTDLGWGYYMPIISVLLFSQSSSVKILFTYWISCLYLATVSAAELRWHLSNMKAIQRTYQLFSQYQKMYWTGKLKWTNFSNSHFCFFFNGKWYWSDLKQINYSKTNFPSNLNYKYLLWSRLLCPVSLMVFPSQFKFNEKFISLSPWL